MKKRTVLCFTFFTELNGKYNLELYYPANGGWADLSLFTCLNCGELFVIDSVENYDSLIKEIQRNETSCPGCSSALGLYLVAYPERFRGANGEVGSFSPPYPISSDLIVKLEIWDISFL